MQPNLIIVQEVGLFIISKPAMQGRLIVCKQLLCILATQEQGVVGVCDRKKKLIQVAARLKLSTFFQPPKRYFALFRNGKECHEAYNSIKV